MPQDILSLYALRGHIQYADEPVTQLEHALQCAQRAVDAGASPGLTLAACLHDVGHLIANLTGTPSNCGLDDRHESVGADALLTIWGEAVAEPVRLHVQAKRYLVSTQPHYKAKLSGDSLRSLSLQGGPMNEAEIQEFQDRPFSEHAVLLRVWDDLSKSASNRAAQTDQVSLGILKQHMDALTRV